jgi:hypothetical protein
MAADCYMLHSRCNKSIRSYIYFYSLSFGRRHTIITHQVKTSTDTLSGKGNISDAPHGYARIGKMMDSSDLRPVLGHQG